MKLTREMLVQNGDLARDRALGALSGLAIGDSFGDAGRKEQNHMDYGVMTDFTQGASWSTDDTEFALFTAQVLIESNGNPTREDFEQGWLKYIATQDEFPRGGGSEIEAAANLRKGLRSPISGMYNSYHMSDGATMRISPIGIVCAGDPEKAKAMAKIDAEVSHYRDGVWAAQSVAAAVSIAMIGGTDEEILDAAMSAIPEGCWLYDSFHQMMEMIDRNECDPLRCWMPLHDDFRTTYKAVVSEAVVQAFGVFRLAQGDFKRGILLGGNFGRDADTIGAVVGALLGGRCGAEKIPSAWIEKTGYPTGTCLQFTKGITIREVAYELASLIR